MKNHTALWGGPLGPRSSRFVPLSRLLGDDFHFCSENTAQYQGRVACMQVSGGLGLAGKDHGHPTHCPCTLRMTLLHLCPDSP